MFGGYRVWNVLHNMYDPYNGVSVRISISSLRNVIIVERLRGGSLDLFLNKEHDYSTLFCSVAQVCHEASLYLTVSLHFFSEKKNAKIVAF